MFIKPKLKGKFTFKNVPETKKPNAPHNAIRKPIAAAEPIALSIENPEYFRTGTFIIAPPIPINEDTKPEIKPNVTFRIKLNFFLISVFSFIKKILKARKYKTILKNNTNDLVCKFAESTVPTITPITTNKP